LGDVASFQYDVVDAAVGETSAGGEAGGAGTDNDDGSAMDAHSVPFLRSRVRRPQR
jgi:hypothetical protein